jgi:ketosteroid isomerase-like protein
MNRRVDLSSMPLPADIQAFFDRYRAAFNALDGEAIARLYAVPSGIASDTGYQHWPAYEPIRDNMVALCQLYRDNGYTEARYQVASFLLQGEQYALADLRWSIERKADQPPWVFNTTYNLVRTADGWRVLLCTAYSEQRLNG